MAAGGPHVTQPQQQQPPPPPPPLQPPAEAACRRSRLRLRAASSPSLPADDNFSLSLPQAPLRALARTAHVLLKFSRPHTLLGTLVSVNSVSLLGLVRVRRFPHFHCWCRRLTASRAQGANPVSGAAMAGLLQALVAALLMNVCIVGINQLYDIEIDRVNKPYLPLASGELSFGGGVAVTCLTGARPASRRPGAAALRCCFLHLLPCLQAGNPRWPGR